MNRILFLLLLSPLLAHAQQLRQSIPLGSDGFLIALEEDEPLLNWQTTSIPLGTDFSLVKFISEEFKILHIRHRSGASTAALLSDLSSHPGIKYAQLNHPVQARQSTPNDPYWEAQWYLHRVGFLSMWQPSLAGQTVQGTPIVLGILEPKGFDTNHEDLQAQFWRNEREVPDDSIDNDNNGYIDDYLGWNAFRGNDEHFSTHPHGTQVAGLISATTNNELGIASIGWNSKLLLLSNNRYESDIVANYLYALALRKRFNETQGREGAFVVATNASFGITGEPEDFPIWCQIYNQLGTQGILSVSAAVNRPVNIDLRADMPTSCNSPYLITVTGVDAFDNHLTGLSFGPQTVDIAAPANQIITTAPNNNYLEITDAGNSFAAPQVTGSIGLMYSLPYEQIQKQALEQPAEMALLMKSFLLDGVQILPSLREKIKSEGRLDLQGTHQLMHTYFNQTAALKIHKVYPNPFVDQVQVDCFLPSLERYNFRIIDLQGRLVSQKVWDNTFIGPQNVDLPLAQLSAGVYFLKIESASATATHKMVKISR